MPVKPTPPVLTQFTRERSTHITVVCTLSGQDARFLVDTGAGGSCIEANALEAYGLSLKGKSQNGGGVGTASMQMRAVAKHDLRLKGLDLSGYQLHALDLSHVNTGLAADKVARVVGVLGADILHDRQAVIDYGRQCMVLNSITLRQTVAKPA